MSVPLPATTRAVLLDIDGVLNDHRAAADSAAWTWASAFPGWSLGPEETAEEWERLDRHYFTRYQLGELTYHQQLAERVRHFLPGAGSLDDVAALDLIDEYFHLYRAAWVPYPDTAAFIARLRATGLPTAYVTNGDYDRQTDKLAAIGALVEGWPVLASAAVGAAKPDPGIFEAACEALGVAPSQAVMIGDDPWADVDGACGAGIPVIHVRRDPGSPRRDAPWVHSLDEIDLP